MTPREFQKKYHEYITQSGDDAKAEAEKVNAEEIDGDKAVAVFFPDVGWGLMLDSAFSHLKETGVLP